MPRQRNKKTQGCQTDYDNWIEHQIHEGVEKIAVKIRSQLKDQVAKLKSDIEAKLESHIEAKLKLNIGKAELKSDIEAKLKSDMEAKLKPDMEAKLKQDIEGKLKRDIQTKLKPDIEAELKTDIKTNHMPDIEAKLKLKLEAKLKSDIASTTEELQGKVEDLENEYYLESRKLQNQLEEKDAHIRLMMEKIDQLEQFTKANNIRIVGMKEEDGEDIRRKVIDLAQSQLNIQNIGIDTIKEAGRMGKRNPTKTRDVLVIFNNSTLRDQIYRKRKLLMNKNDPIYINEDLTQYRSQLFFEARKIRKRGQLFGAWTQGGNVLIKLNQNDIPRAVSSLHNLMTLVQNYADSDDK